MTLDARRDKYISNYNIHIGTFIVYVIILLTIFKILTYRRYTHENNVALDLI